jgi:hypothetical protein
MLYLSQCYIQIESYLHIFVGSLYPSALCVVVQFYNSVFQCVFRDFGVSTKPEFRSECEKSVVNGFLR